MKPTTKLMLGILNEIYPDTDATPTNLAPQDAALYAAKYRDQEDEEDHGLKRCHVNGKLCFPSANAASIALRRIQRKRNHYLRVYQCPDCHHHHLSSTKRK